VDSVESLDGAGRYAVQEVIEWWDQLAVSNSIILVAGVGALGNEVIKDLTLAGVGTLVLVDFDRVEVHNLTRSALFGMHDIGNPKVIAASNAISHLNPDVHVIPMNADVNMELGAGVVARCDLVMGCLDSRGSRLSLNRLCFDAGTPYIDGGLRVMDGAVKLFNEGGPCFECGLTEPDYHLLAARYPCPGFSLNTKNPRISQPREPTLISAASITGGLMSQLALQILCGQVVEGGWCITYRGSSLDMEKVELPLRHDCTGHNRIEMIKTTGLGVSCAARDLLSDGGALLLPYDIGFQKCRCGELLVCKEPRLSAGSFVECHRCDATVKLRFTHRIDANHPLAGMSLERLGVPRLAWMTIDGEEETKYLELDADEIDVFAT